MMELIIVVVFVLVVVAFLKRDKSPKNEEKGNFISDDKPKNKEK